MDSFSCFESSCCSGFDSNSLDVSLGMLRATDASQQKRTQFILHRISFGELNERWMKLREMEMKEINSPQAPPLQPPEKASSKPASKVPLKKGKTTEEHKEEVLDPIAEKLRQQRLVEEAAYKTTKELFGKGGDVKNLDNFIPNSESDFLEYAELIYHKLQPYEKSFHHIGLLKAVMRFSTTSLKAGSKRCCGFHYSNCKRKAKSRERSNCW